MEAKEIKNLNAQAEAVLKTNDRKHWTVPAPNLYPHQWLWDSCFTAIGLRHIDLDRAMKELTSLVRGQWSNGMLPNIVFSADKKYQRDRNLWRSWVSPFSPANVCTTGITQPPMLAEAVVAIGEKLKMPERRSWYSQMYPPLLAFHEWLYNERDPHNEGLVVLVHPFESGMDSSPVWTSELYKHGLAWWIRAAKALRLDFMVNFFRRDTRVVPASHRMDNFQAMAYWAALLRLRRKAYNSHAVLRHPLFAIEDLAFNSILVRANEHLAVIAKTIGRELPAHLQESSKKIATALEELWDDNSGQYFSRSFISKDFIEVPTISTFLPLYAGTPSKEKATRLVELLKSSKHFSSPWPVPSVPLNSAEFDPVRYWQGPSWVNMNWLIIKGLERNGYPKEAEELKQRTLQTVMQSGFSEYFNPLTGEAAGVPNFSWTAALAIDLLRN